MRSTTFVLVLACAQAAFTGVAFAGVNDSVVSSISASGSTHTIYIIPGVIKNNNLETAFVCTSLERSGNIAVGVEIFDNAGNGPLNNAALPTLEGVETVSPGETVTITTGSTVALHEDDVMTSLPAASVRNGSARIIATSKRIACTAFLVDELNDPPLVLAPLPMISKKQRGD